MSANANHPRSVLSGSLAAPGILPVCDHYSGVESRMRKSLQLQEEMAQEYGRCVFDVTLDCEDGAPVGGENEHAQLVASLACQAAPGMRVAARLHAPDHPAFGDDVATLVTQAGEHLCHLMIPKVDTPAVLQQAIAAIDAAGGACLPIHALLESPLAVCNALAIAAHPRVQSLSFGLMDFVSAHGGALPARAMSAHGQFSHPVVVQAKLAIAAACHAHGKTPSHCVVTEFSDSQALRKAARTAAGEFGYTRMWSIHPAQVRTIIDALSPDHTEVEMAAEIIEAAHAAQWAPISYRDILHDRASYRYYWQLLERAAQTGQVLPEQIRLWLTPLTK